MKKLFVFIFFISFFKNSTAQIGAQNAYEFLSMPVSTRSIALGGMLPAYSFRDLAVAIESPSLLNKSYDRNFYSSQELMFAQIYHGQFGYAKYQPKLDATFAGSIQYLNYGNFIKADETGAQTGHFGAEEMAMQLGFGKNLNAKFSYGANTKFIYSRYDDLTATAVAADLSTSYKDTAKKICLTFQILNVGTQLKTFYPNVYYEGSHIEGLPTDVRFGISKRLSHMPFSIQISAHHLQQFDIRYNNPLDNVTTNIFGQDSTPTKTKNYIADKIFRHLAFGGEFYFGKHLTVQIGYNHLRRQELKTSTLNGAIGFSGGFHISTKKFTFGFSHAWYYLPSATNTISLTFLI